MPSHSQPDSDSSDSNNHAVPPPVPAVLHGARRLRRRLRPGPWNVVVLAGGESAERQISLESGANVLDALRQGGHTARLIDPWEAVDLFRLNWSDVDVAFLALHGTYGEDGQVQSVLERLKVPYTGSDPFASELAFSKASAKELFIAHEVPTPAYHVLVSAASDAVVRRAAEQIGFPLVIKPDRQGSSLGVSWVEAPAALPAAWTLACQYDSRVLLEQAICGGEWTVGLLDSQTLPPIQIGTPGVIFDFHAKYTDEQTSYAFGANVSSSLLRTLEDAAQRAAAALQTRGIVRVDLKVDAAACPWVLEVNTIPGFTSHSLVPKAAARLGWSMTELCERAIESALGNQPVQSDNPQGLRGTRRAITSIHSPTFAEEISPRCPDRRAE